jgi:hypothetical protein
VGGFTVWGGATGAGGDTPSCGGALVTGGLTVGVGCRTRGSVIGLVTMGGFSRQKSQPSRMRPDLSVMPSWAIAVRSPASQSIALTTRERVPAASRRRV